jgi:tetratricopeptide (TPR) repeat protein
VAGPDGTQSNLADIPDSLRVDPERIEFPDPPVVVKPPILPFEKISWLEFQRLCVRLLETVEGVSDVQMFGVQGQTQDGIDVCGHLINGTGIAWQARRVKRFSAEQFRQAVDEFANGKRPLDATTFAVAVSLALDETEFAEELHALGIKYPDLAISLKHGGELSKMLEAQPRLVERFFGVDWRKAFCDDAASGPDQVQVSAPTVDQLLRGPIAALGLSEQLEEAESAVESDPQFAAQELHAVAMTLYEKGFPGHAGTVTRKEAKTLAASGQIDAALQLLLDLLVEDAREGVISAFSFGFHEARELIPQAADAGHRFVLDALEALAELFESPEAAIDGLALCAAVLEDRGDALAAEVSMWHAEAAIAFRDTGHLSNASERIGRLLPDVKDPSLRVRLELCVADADGNWDEVVQIARRRAVSPSDAALILRRFGRWLALQGRLVDAETAFSESLSPSMEARLEGDAGEALFTIRALKLLRGDFSGEIAQIYELSKLFTRQESYPFPEGGSWRSALDSRWRSSLPEAHDRAVRVMWKATVCGHLQSERDAHALLGSIYADSGELEDAIHQFIWAGKENETKDIARQIGEPLDLADVLTRSLTPWESVCALKAVAWQGHLMDEDEVATVIDRVIEIAQEPALIQSPSPGRAAVEALAGVSLSIPPNKVSEVEGILVPLLERQPGRYKPTDEASIGVLLGLYRTQADRRNHLGALLLDALQDDLVLGSRALAAVDSLPAESISPLVGGLRDLANSGNHSAAQILASNGIDDPAVVAEAQRRSDWIESLSPRPNPHQWTGWSGIPEAGVFGRFLTAASQALLIERLMAIAEDGTELEVNRGNALAGIANLAIDVPAVRTAELFERVVALADPDVKLSEVDKENRASLHPRSRFKMDWGVGVLSQTSAVAAASLATTPEQARQVFEIVAGRIRGSDDEAAAGAQALSLLDERLIDFDLDLMARHPLSTVRKSAVTVWARRGFEPTGLGDTFARDQDDGVRARLAGNLVALEALNPTMAQTLRVVAAEDRATNVRLALGE